MKKEEIKTELGQIGYADLAYNQRVLNAISELTYEDEPSVDATEIQSFYETLINDLKEAQKLNDGSEYGLKVALYELEHSFSKVGFNK